MRVFLSMIWGLLVHGDGVQYDRNDQFMFLRIVFIRVRVPGTLRRRAASDDYRSDGLRRSHHAVRAHSWHTRSTTTNNTALVPVVAIPAQRVFLTLGYYGIPPYHQSSSIINHPSEVQSAFVYRTHTHIPPVHERRGVRFTD